MQWLRWEYPRWLPAQARRCIAWNGSLRVGRSAGWAPQQASLRGPPLPGSFESAIRCSSLRIGRMRQHAGADESEQMPIAGGLRRDRPGTAYDADPLTSQPAAAPQQTDDDRLQLL